MTTSDLKTVAFGGYDKKDVLDYVDILNGRILKLENELTSAQKEAKNARMDTANLRREAEELRSVLNEQPDETEQSHAFQREIDAARQSVEQYRASADNLTAELIRVKSANAELERENTSLKLKVEEERRRHESELGQAKKVEAGAIDIGNILIDARRAADDILEDARVKAENTLLQTEEQRAQTSAQLDEMAGRLREIEESLDRFYEESSAGLARTAQLVSAAHGTVLTEEPSEPETDTEDEEDNEIAPEANVFL